MDNIDPALVQDKQMSEQNNNLPEPQNVTALNPLQTTTDELENTSGRRYNTRSATGRFATRKADDHGTKAAPVQQSSKNTKKYTVTTSSKRRIDQLSDEEQGDDEQDGEVKKSRPRRVRSKPSSPDYAFNQSSSTVPARRGRAVLPIPVPNLTKKSRGRRVPTDGVDDADLEEPVPRTYVCKVEGCGKCFHRGEHLKRHIRSIHTHEKPFKCSVEGCDKFFNRHDNLLQHLKVHKDPDALKAERATPSIRHHQHHHRKTKTKEKAKQDDGYGTSNSSENAYPQPRIPFPSASLLETSYEYFAPIGVPTAFATDVSSLRTDMAVSSLRTELPRSPQQNTQTLPQINSTFRYDLQHEQNIHQQHYERMHHRLELEGSQPDHTTQLENLFASNDHNHMTMVNNVAQQCHDQSASSHNYHQQSMDMHQEHQINGQQESASLLLREMATQDWQQS